MKLACIAFLAIAAVAAQADLIYTFDTDNQGWGRADFNAATLVLTDLGPATWNAGGFIDANDFSAWAFHVSPVLSGNFTGSTSFSLDFSSTLTDNVPYPFVVLASATEAIYQDPIVPGDGTFHAYSFDLTSATNWKYGNSGGLRGATMADIDNVLGSLTRIGVNADIGGGNDYTRLDNVRLNAVPEPATMAALGLGVAALLRRRRK